MKYILIGFLFFLFIGISGFESVIYKSIKPPVTDSTIMSGRWSNPLIWSNGTVPDGGSKDVVISNETFVIVDVNIAVNSVLIRQHGNVIFDRNKFLNNICLHYEPDSIIENNVKTALYSNLNITCVNTYPPPNYTLKIVCTGNAWNDSTIVTNKTVRNGYWSNPKTFNTNSVPNSNTAEVYAKEYFNIHIDTSVIVKRFVARRANVYWTKGAVINGVSHQNYRVY